MKNTYLLTSLLFSIFSYSEDIDVTQPIRINQLIPRELTPITLSIDPALPSNFVALSNLEGLNSYALTYWGPEGVARAYLEDRNSLKEPIIMVTFAEGTQQKKFGALDEKAITKSCTCDNSIQVSYTFGNWGEHPYCVMSGTIEERPFNMLYVGSNALGGVVMLFDLVAPKTPNGEAEALELWDRFIKETKPLSEPLLFKAHGQELHPGYTIVDVANRKIKVIAEKRKSDAKIRFSVIPQDLTVWFNFKSALVGVMEANWHNNEPLLKIKGSYIVDKGWVTNFQTTSILIKEVEEFTAVPILRKNVFFKELPQDKVYHSIYQDRFDIADLFFFL